MAYLAAISTATTIPLFIRTKGDLPQLSFPVVGSLSSVHLYASNMKAALLSCSSPGSKVTWRCFYDSITLILVMADEGASDTHASYLLELVFNAMVLLVGLHDLEYVSDDEELKRTLKCCYPLIDCILQGTPLMAPLTQCVEVMALENKDILSRTLEAFTEAAQSNYGCLTVHGRVCAATESWWELSSLEINLLSLFIYFLPPASSRDIPVYLPRASNKTAHRLLTFTLVEGVTVSVLCNPEPPLNVVQKSLDSYWSPMITILRNTTHLYPRNVPFELNFDHGILAFCLVNLDTRQSLTSLKPHNTASRTTLTAGFHGEMSQSKKLTYLMRFYKATVDNLLPQARDKLPQKDSSTDDQKANTEGKARSSLRGRVAHRIIETYTHAKHYKAYAINRHKHNLLVVFSPLTPTFSLRKLTIALLDYLIKNNILT